MINHGVKTPTWLEEWMKARTAPKVISGEIDQSWWEFKVTITDLRIFLIEHPDVNFYLTESAGFDLTRAKKDWILARDTILEPPTAHFSEDRWWLPLDQIWIPWAPLTKDQVLNLTIKWGSDEVYLNQEGYLVFWFD